MFLRGNKLALDDEDLKKCFGNLYGVYFYQLYQSYNRNHFLLCMDWAAMKVIPHCLQLLVLLIVLGHS